VVRFEVLGPIRIRAGADEVPVRGRRERTLLAMLLLDAGKPVPADRLIDAIWGDAPPATARNQVQVAVFRLRNRLADAGAATPILLTDQDGYRAQVPGDQRELSVDLGEFHAEVAAARRSATIGDAARARDLYRTALARWRGPAFADVDSPPVRQAAAALDDERLHAHEECLRLDLSLGAGGELVAELTELVAAHPYRERLHAALMRALYRAGRQADALAAYRRIRILLHDELGTEPGAELQQLHRAILNGDIALTTPEPPPAAPPAGDGPQVLVRLLGPVELWGERGRLALGTPRQRCVLALLAMTPGQPVALETLVDRVWGDQAPRNARDVLYSHVSRLRGPLRQVGGDLVRRDGGYVLEVDSDRVDLHRARRLAADARAATGTPAGERRAAKLLGEARGLWRGTPLAGLPGDWAARVRSGLDQERLATLTEWFEVELRRGEHASVIGPLSAAQAEYPLAEPLAGQLMLALYRIGRQADALEVYPRLRRRLVDEIGDEPAGWLRELHGRILRRDAGLAPPAGPGNEGALAVGAAEAGAVQLVPAQLPPDVAAFTGRGRELGQLDALLADDATGPAAMAIAAIEGAPGVGKTALAVHWAHRVRHRFPDGQLYADLRGFAPGPPLQPVDILARFLPALGMPRDQVPTDVDEAVAAYRSLLADRRVLVALDNAADPGQVRPLLPGGPGSLVLVTSRDQFTGLVAREGAHRVCLEVLPDEESVALLERLLGAERTRVEPAATAELAQLCDHLPLALRVAAANLGSRPRHRIADYVTQLREADRLGALAVSGDADSAVPAAFDLSYTRLPDTARRVFRLLGLAPGRDISTDAAAELAGVTSPEAGRLLDGLAGAHLVEERAPGRYGCHELLRRYAADRAQVEETRDDRAAALARLHAYYLAAAAAAVQEVIPVSVRLPVPQGAPPPQFDDVAQALAWLDAERTNLVAVVSQAAEHGPPQVGWRLADVLRGYFGLGPYLGDWLTTARAGVAAATSDGDPQALAAAYLNLAHLRLRRSSYREAIEHATTAVASARTGEWVEGQAAILNLLGNAYWSMGELAMALEHYERALAGFERLGWKQVLAAMCGNLARVTVEMGRLADAAAYARRGLAEPRTLGVPIAEAIALEVLGEVHHARGRLPDATELFTRARDVSRAGGYHSGEADALHGLAVVARDLGDHTRAATLAEAALALANEHSLRRVEADCLTLLSGLRGGSGAVDGYRRALELARAAGDRHPEAEALVGLAAAHRLRGEYVHAHASATDALTIARKVGYRLLEGRALTALAEVCLADGAYDQAAAHGEAALEVTRETGHRLGQARAHLVLGRAAQASDQPDAARDHWRTAQALFADIGMPAAGDVATLLTDVT
jgi:DNA-binding SARP family transcriptional activator